MRTRHDVNTSPPVKHPDTPLVTIPAHPPTYVIFGATGGIGSQLATLLAADGANVVLAARDPSKLDTLVQGLPTSSAAALPQQVDVLDPQQVEHCIQEAVKHAAGGRIDGVANCVGSVLLKSAHTTSVAEVCWCGYPAGSFTTHTHMCAPPASHSLNKWFHSTS